MSEPVKILARPTSDPARCDFELDRPLVDGTARFANAADAEGSPLAVELFALGHVAAVEVCGPVVSVTKEGDVEWMNLAKQVGAAIRAAVQGDGPAVAEAAVETPKPAEIRIIARPQVDPTKCDFEVDRTVHDGVGYFPDASTAEGSALPTALFALEGIREVMVRGPIVTVTRTEDAAWAELARQVGGAIRTQLQTGAPAVAPGAGATDVPQDDGDVRRRVNQVIESEINPAVASHGGYITVRDVRGGVVTITMGGGCQGCSSSMATLKQGVETTLKARVPEVVAVVDGTNHEAGDNPYYN